MLRDVLMLVILIMNKQLEYKNIMVYILVHASIAVRQANQYLPRASTNNIISSKLMLLYRTGSCMCVSLSFLRAANTGILSVSQQQLTIGAGQSLLRYASQYLGMYFIIWHLKVYTSRQQYQYPNGLFVMLMQDILDPYSAATNNRCKGTNDMSSRILCHTLQQLYIQTFLRD